MQVLTQIIIEYIQDRYSNITLYILYFREKLLSNVEEEENYNLLEDIYETLNYDCGKIKYLFYNYIIVKNSINI